MEAYEALARVYDKLMDDIDYDMWAAYIGGLIGRGNARVFEAACGTGNIACRLQAQGHIVTAADSSAAMLRAASEKARAAGLGVVCVQQDMRGISVGNRVDAVVCACDGPNYLDAEGLCLFATSAYAALKPDGLLLFDISTHAKLKSMDAQVYFDDGDDVTCIWQNRFDDTAHTLTMDITLFVRQGGLFAKQTETHVQHAHDVQTVLQAAREAGFASAEVFECFSHAPLGGHAQRAQFVCRKTL